MKLPRVYVSPPLSRGQLLALPAPDSHHLIRVLRLAPGAALVVSDGCGTDYAATLLGADKKGREVQARVELGESRPNLADAQKLLHLGVAFGSLDRFERMLEQLAEMGVASLTPLLSARSQVREVSDAKRNRWLRIAEEGSQLAGRATPLRLRALQSLEEFLSDGPGCLLHQSGSPDSRPLLNSTRLAVGPEGGFTEAETFRAAERGWSVCSLGPRNLRVETAALVVAALCLT